MILDKDGNPSAADVCAPIRNYLLIYTYIYVCVCIYILMYIYYCLYVCV